MGLVASTSEALSPSTVSIGRPVGRSLPVPAPPGSTKSSAMRAPRPATPGSSKSPATAASPSVTGTWATMIFFVFVLWMRTTATPSAPRTRAPRRWRRAPRTTSSCRSCRCSRRRAARPRPARRCSPRRRPGGSVGPMMHALERDEIPPPRPLSWRPYGSGLPRAASRMRSRSAPAGGRSLSWKTRQRLVPPRM